MNDLKDNQTFFKKSWCGGWAGILTESDVKKMIEATDLIRNKAIIALLYEGGLRIGEPMNM